MKRRRALLSIALVSSSIAAIGGFKWFSWHKAPDFAFLNEQTSLLDALAETILPATDTPGAVEAGVPDFIRKMILENTPVVGQNRFINGLKDIDEYSINTLKKPYAQCSKEQQNEVMRHFEEQGKPLSGLPGKVERKLVGNSFFTILKEYTCIGYCTSMVGATQGLAYELVPDVLRVAFHLRPAKNPGLPNNLLNVMNPVFINSKGKKEHTFDAIVVGSGISGGWAAKELCEKGLKTLVLERGRQVEHITDYPTAMKSPWEFPNRLNTVLKDQLESPIQSQSYNEGDKHFYVNDTEHPYIQEKPFSWIRGYQVGGRSLTWGRQCYRLSDLDFEANAREGVAVDWPIRYKDLAPWYDHVEQFVGISGRAEGLSQLPDGKFLPPMEFNCIENHFSNQVKKHYKDRIVTIARTANLSRGWNGRGPCQYRNLCSRGCPYGGYFSSNSATLPAAASTGNLTLQPDSIVTEVLFDEKQNRATGVRVLNFHTKQVTEYFAKIIFLNASTIATAALLLNSTSSRFPNGFGNSSGQIGHNLMDHFMMGGANGEHPEFADQYYEGRRPIGFYVPRFRNLNAQTQRKDYQRGFGYQGDGERAEWPDQYKRVGGFGADFKNSLTKPGPWTLFLGAWGETLPYFENRISLDAQQKDQWGLPLVRVFFEYHENEMNMRKDIKESAAEMLDRAGFQNVAQYYYDLPPGSAVHEMGTARMGLDPKTSVLNAFNQMHDAKNVYITDGSCMTSAACQNPSLTYMALTARACDHAVTELKKLNL